MSLKYVINLLLALAGGFLVVASRTFAPNTAGWLGLGIGIFAVVLAGVGAAAGGLRLRSAGYAVTALVGVWTIVSSSVFSGSLLGWLVFADALALVAVALADLTAHEVSTERVVHTLDVRERAGIPTAA
ncbi:MAG TPA: hypothetical protein VGL21_10455 [Jatrophihabitantaceae bacterium]|jgi:hypothetical protein